MPRRARQHLVSLYKNFFLSRKQWNVILDKEIRSIEKVHSPLYENTCLHTAVVFDCSTASYRQWLTRAKSSFLNVRYPHKKALEFFFSAMLLNIQKDDIVLDAAGGRSEYLSNIRNVVGCRNLYVNDQIYSTGNVKRGGVNFVGGDVTAIGLPDGAVTKIACHHAVEHFRGDKDARFVLEISRLLKTGGRACILPLFIADRYAEVWNIKPESCYDQRAMCIEDPSSSLPGGKDDGHFARIYDSRALSERVLATADSASLRATIMECTLDGQAVPDMSLNFGSRINRPLRALVLEKV
ncbi:Methyltransferase type 11 [Desulfosudis oleivorans Hxd3]|uniref:Methyltransferase type 11 n=2 Tax=Desulfosudis TaxID=2904716 RepID=A8ZU29_DESOH|nr:Methyltransferase type 11 [Desulfosudis oleivorans Hxd3]